AEVESHIDSLSGFNRPAFEELHSELPKALIELLTDGICNAVSQGNRLAVARYLRYLHHLEQRPGTKLGTLAQQAIEQLEFRLWPEVDRLKDPEEKCRKLLAGLLILFPQNLKVLRTAFGTLSTLGNHEQSRGHNQHETSRALASLLAGYDQAFANQVFVNYPHDETTRPDSSTSDLLPLHWYFYLRVTSEPITAFELRKFLDALDPLLRERGM
ncbi:MAG: hypothetical protein KDA84_22450, partial [Planctomycetaceae bacterium]|nr:hypothetical protein [Planctomycetaceae bacterium]